eukprot:4246430-Pleurochrysis_carterae.AAC.1
MPVFSSVFLVDLDHNHNLTLLMTGTYPWLSCNDVNVLQDRSHTYLLRSDMTQKDNRLPYDILPAMHDALQNITYLMYSAALIV